MPRLFHHLLLLLLCCSVHLGADAADPPIRVAVLSDINGRYGTAEYHRRVAGAIDAIIALRPDVVISTGDMVAGQRPDPLLGMAELESLWRAFHATVHAPLRAAGIPLVMTPGNHDASAYPAYATEREMYARYHAAHPPLLAPRAGGYPPFYFAVDLGPLRLIALDATRPGPLATPQHAWLAEELATAAGRPVLVFGHLPLQPIAIGREQDIITDPALETLLAEAGVTAYLSGHHHAFYPGWRAGIPMLSVGNLGGNPRTLVGTGQSTGFSFLVLEITADGSMAVEARLAPDFTGALHWLSLPETLGRGDQALQRLDTRPADD